MGQKRKPSRKPSKTTDFPVVGVGASAGGLEAFTALLKALRTDTGMAFVLVQHMDPMHESLLNQLLSKATTMPVTQVADHTPLKPNRVYVIPPNKDLSIDRGVLLLTDLRSGHMPIDNFFSSLARDRRDKAIGVILSGTASDGTYGLKAIKDMGGITFAQDQKSAKYTGMPASAAASGYVDFVLPPRGIARKLQDLPLHPRVIAPQPVSEPPTESDPFKEVLRLLKTATDVDFSLYKPMTVKRRIRRRMGLREIADLDHYARYLQSHPVEVRDLFDDILISVTGFFREPETFQALQKDVFPKIVASAKKTKSIRIWVPGCATGEEVYSIAIALLEHLGDQAGRVQIQIFGTDLSDRVIQIARNGLYNVSAVEKISAARLRRFFMKVEGGYQIAKSVREICIFARQDLAKDPPFAKLDLISCQNVFIYLGAVLQKRIMAVFHFALKPSGFLVLGRSEAPMAYTDFFTLNDRKNKVFSRKPTPARPLPSMPTLTLERTPPMVEVGAEAPASNFVDEGRRILLENYSSPALFVDSSLNILHFQGDTSPFLKPTTGTASFNLLKMLRPEFAVEVRPLVHRVRKAGIPARKEGIEIKHGGELRRVAMEVVSVPTASPGLTNLMVLFSRMETARSEDAKGHTRGAGRNPREILALQRDLETAREALKSITEDQEAANEELKTANEEILSSNEELQSTNEELETAKEELQSANEELTTLNEELQNRNVELTTFADDLSSLLTGVNIPIVILDNNRRIQRFTPAAQRMFNLIPTDIGRPFGDISSELKAVNWDELFSRVLDHSQVVDVDAAHRDGRWYSLKMRPYKTRDDGVDGVLMALLDVDKLKLQLSHSETSLEKSEELYRLVTENTLDLVALHDAAGKYVYASPSSAKLLGYSNKEIIGQSPAKFCHPDDRRNVEDAFKAVARSGKPGHITHRAMTKDGNVVWLDVLIGAITDVAEKVTQMQASSRNITERKRAEDELQVLTRRLMSVQDEEARRISRELHDTFSQELMALSVESRLLKRGLPRKERNTATKIEEISQRIGRLAAAIHQTSRRLHPTVLDDLGLSAALRGECSAFSELHHIRTDFSTRGVPKSVPESVALCIYRVAHECLRNVAKHSGAEKVRVYLGVQKGEIHLAIEDFGKGFDLEKQKRRKHGLGLIGMEERVHSVKGRWTIDSKPGKGTRIHAYVPLKSA